MIEDQNGNRVLYLNLDNGMISQLLRTRVLARLKKQFGPVLFNQTNVMLTGEYFGFPFWVHRAGKLLPSVLKSRISIVYYELAHRKVIAHD